MKKYIIIPLLLLGCNSKNKNCETQHIERKKTDNAKELIKEIRDCDKHLLKEYEIRDINKDSFIYDGFHKEYYADGKLKILAFFKNGIQDSITIKYREAGTKEGDNYYVDGVQKGFQNIYYPNGSYRIRSYHKSDTEVLYKVLYDTSGVITQINGKVISAFWNEDPDRLTLGKSMLIANEVPVFDNVESKLDIKLVSKNNRKEIINQTVYNFQEMNNFHFKAIMFTPKEKGIYDYTAVITLTQKDNNMRMKCDTLSFKIICN